MIIRSIIDNIVIDYTRIIIPTRSAAILVIISSYYRELSADMNMKYYKVNAYIVLIL